MCRGGASFSLFDTPPFHQPNPSSTEGQLTIIWNRPSDSPPTTRSNRRRHWQHTHRRRSAGSHRARAQRVRVWCAGCCGKCVQNLSRPLKAKIVLDNSIDISVTYRLGRRYGPQLDRKRRSREHLRNPPECRCGRSRYGGCERSCAAYCSWCWSKVFAVEGGEGEALRECYSREGMAGIV